MDTEQLEARVAALEERVSAVVKVWNELIHGDAKASRLAAIEERCDGFFLVGGEISKMGEEIAKTLVSHRKRFADIEARTDGVMAYRGVHQRALTYSKGDAVTSDGSLWVALRSTSGVKPGTNDDFQLVAKGNH